MLDHCNLIAFVPTLNADLARDFYEHTLGLRFVSEDQFALVFDCNGIMLRIVRAPKFQPFPFTILGWEVPDIRQYVARLRNAGVAFERFGFFEQDDLAIWNSHSGSKVAWFKDPDGNTLSISQH
ncbi:MAG: VOC family protein [Acidobacteriaceae bacterium]